MQLGAMPSAPSSSARKRLTTVIFASLAVTLGRSPSVFVHIPGGNAGGSSMPDRVSVPGRTPAKVDAGQSAKDAWVSSTAAAAAALLLGLAVGGSGALAADDSTKQLAEIKRQALMTALKNAEEKAKQKELEVENLQKAESLLENLDSKRAVEVKKKEETFKKQEVVREKILADLDKKASAPAKEPAAAAEAEKIPLAQKFFRSFFQKQEQKAKEIKKDDTEAAALRQKVLDDLEKRKQEARQAAVEAEAVAKRLEELAKNARETAQEAARLAAAADA
eukprot:TRINITY_DN35674_c0_g1_i1.p1 TRINITY_DN35674_c0_g1~~TRINITY_DN35674_c0_g1_i1.p1  ORF type:complete len:287 (+),score=104.24 TRINITY_DN35674_c0_g1_i1:30-863(+)